MEIIKRIASAISMAILLALPLALLEAAMVYHVISIYGIPYFSNFGYSHILGLSFILMITRNRVRLPEKNQRFPDFKKEILPPTINRFFRILFVWVVAITLHTYILAI